jgi:hypothetical protein
MYIYIYIYCTLYYDNDIQYNSLCSLQNIPFASADLLRATAQASKGTNNKYFILKEKKTCHVIKAKGTVVQDLDEIKAFR